LAKHLQVRAKAGWLRARIMYFELSVMATCWWLFR